MNEYQLTAYLSGYTSSKLDKEAYGEKNLAKLLKMFAERVGATADNSGFLRKLFPKSDSFIESAIGIAPRSKIMKAIKDPTFAFDDMVTGFPGAKAFRIQEASQYMDALRDRGIKLLPQDIARGIASNMEKFNRGTRLTESDVRSWLDVKRNALATLKQIASGAPATVTDKLK